MLPLVNARGVPGALGAVATGVDGAAYFITCHHVLFGRGARIGDKVWAVDEERHGSASAEIGRAVGGRIGRVTYQGRPCFIDCGLGLLNETARLPGFVRQALEACNDRAGVAGAVCGGPVSKTGWITGQTQGTVVETGYYDRVFIGERSYEAPGQLLIRPAAAEAYFSAAGESGAAVIDAANRVVGFLWGSNANGEGIAYPAGVALEHLGLVLDLAHARRGLKKGGAL